MRTSRSANTTTTGHGRRMEAYRQSQYPTLSASFFPLFFLLWYLYLPCQRYELLEASSRTWALLAISSWLSTSNFVHSTTHIRAQWNADGREPQHESWHVGMLLTSKPIVFVHKADIKGRSVLTPRSIGRPRARIYVSGQSGHEREQKLYHERHVIGF